MRRFFFLFYSLPLLSFDVKGQIEPVRSDLRLINPYPGNQIPTSSELYTIRSPRISASASASASANANTPAFDPIHSASIQPQSTRLTRPYNRVSEAFGHRTLRLQPIDPLQPLQSECSTASGSISKPTIHTLLGVCRGQTLPEADQLCVYPSGSVDLAVEVNNTGLSKWKREDVSVGLVVLPPGNEQLGQVNDGFQTGQDAEYWSLNAPLQLLSPTVNPGQIGQFRAVWSAPPMVGVHHLRLALLEMDNCTNQTQIRSDSVEIRIQVTCSDQLFCNGLELFINDENGPKCVKGQLACEDNDECTVDTCDESLGVCMHYMHTNATLPPNRGLEYCISQNWCSGGICVPQCNKEDQCGADGCGSSCKVCPVGSGCHVDHRLCHPFAGTEYTCANPKPLLKSSQTILNAPFLIELDQLKLHRLDHVTPTCTKLGTHPDYVFVFDVPTNASRGYGFDMQVVGKYNVQLDTIMELRTGSCFDLPFNPPNNTILPAGPAVNNVNMTNIVGCNDNGVPPSGGGSHLSGLLRPGRYYLIISTVPVFEMRHLNKSNPNAVELFHDQLSRIATAHPTLEERINSALALSVRFTDGYVPSCDANFCGPDSGGQMCGHCLSGYKCNDLFQCVPDPCVPNCTNRTCGDNGCGSSCGECSDGLLCANELGNCVNDTTTQCNGLLPQCAEKCSSDHFCANDCKCYPITNYQLPDLVVKMKTLTDEMSIINYNFTNTTCSLIEGCIAGTGLRKLLRFSVSVFNQGTADLVLPDPASHPASFFYSPCHNHYHYNGFASYHLIANNSIVFSGHKQAFCLEDTQAEHVGKNVQCLAHHTCTSPGIQRGWSDYYGADLDCQWIDITDIKPGIYTLRVEVNVHRRLLESTFDNNAAYVQVVIP